MKETVVSGIRPTGNLHLGNYFGAVKSFLQMQNDELLHLEKNYIKIDGEKYDKPTKNITVFEKM